MMCSGVVKLGSPPSSMIGDGARTAISIIRRMPEWGVSRTRWVGEGTSGSQEARAGRGRGDEDVLGAQPERLVGARVVPDVLPRGGHFGGGAGGIKRLPRRPPQ